MQSVMTAANKEATLRGRGSALGVFVALRRYFVTAAAFSLAINLLYLAAPLYMMQVYDRVLSSGSEATLVLLTLIVLVAFSTLAALDCLRARILARVSTRLDRLLAPRIFKRSANSARSR